MKYTVPEDEIDEMIRIVISHRKQDYIERAKHFCYTFLILVVLVGIFLFWITYMPEIKPDLAWQSIVGFFWLPVNFTLIIADIVYLLVLLLSSRVGGEQYKHHCPECFKREVEVEAVYLQRYDDSEFEFTQYTERRTCIACKHTWQCISLSDNNPYYETPKE